MESARNYNKGKCKADIMAGLTVAVVGAPQAMAYAMIAGVDPVYGLYAAILPVIIASLFGSSNFNIAGPTNALSMVVYSSMFQIFIGGIVASSLPDEQRLSFIFMLSLLTGAIQLFLGISRLGGLANYISHSVILGFTTGASLLIVLGQIRNLFGLEFEAPASTLALIGQIITHIVHIDIATFLVAITTLAVAIAIKKYFPKAPYALLTLIIVSAVCNLFNAQNFIAMSPPVPEGLPPLFIPSITHLSALPSMFFSAVAIALLASVESIAIGKTMASSKDERFDSNQELIGQGLGNIIACFSSSIPGCASFSRSAVNYSAGARTRFAGVISGATTLFVLVLLGPFMNYIPISALAALLILICLNMIHLEDIRYVIRTSKSDYLVFLITLVSVFIFSLEQAVFIGVFLSLSIFIKKQSEQSFHPLEKEMIPVKDNHPLLESKKLHIFCFEGPLFFGSVGDFEKNLRHIEAIDDVAGNVIILHMDRVNMIDVSSIHELHHFLEHMEKAKAHIIMCSSSPAVLKSIKRSRIHVNTHAHVVRTMQEAFDIAEKLLGDV